MNQLDDLYREVVLEHSRNPLGREPLSRVDVQADGKNPSCGDECTISLELEGDRIAGVHVSGRGCAISTASGSMLAELVEGATASDANNIANSFRGLLQGSQNTELPDESVIDLGDLEALAGVRKFPLRVKCAMLPWTTLDQALLAREDEAQDKEAQHD